ncbi:MAG: CHAD domain-containing protein, partial [Burkholderiales bacterium]|nr:CHAD domain-containing protein [Burkholderiales bacterium]
FSTFSGALPQEEAALFVAEIKWLARALGPARDWDVFMTETLPPILRDFGGQAGLAELSKQGARARTAARRRAQNAIASARYQRLNLMLPAWLVAEFRFNPGDEAGPDALRVPAPSFAGAALDRRFARARKRGRKLRQLSAAELHLLRIAVKKLRYVADSFAALYDEKCIARMLARLARLQNILGAMNDAATVSGLMKRLGAKSGKDMSEARGIVLGWTKGRAEALKYEFYSAWKAFRDCGKCW